MPATRAAWHRSTVPQASDRYRTFCAGWVAWFAPRSVSFGVLVRADRPTSRLFWHHREVSDQSQGAGWWLASDGRWYPPEVHPEVLRRQSPWAAPGESTSPDSSSTATSMQEHTTQVDQYWPLIPSVPAKRRRVRWSVVGPLLVVAVIALAALAARAVTSDHGDGSSTAASDVPATGPVVTARGGTISLTLPAGWRGADVSNGVDAVGATLFPGDPRTAAEIQQRLSVLPRAVVLFGARPPSTTTTLAFTDNVNVLSDPTAPPNLGLDHIGPAEAHGIGQFATVTSQGAVDLAGRPAYRIIYTKTAFSGVSFIIEGTFDTWVLTYTFGAARPDVGLAQSSAMTFNAP